MIEFKLIDNGQKPRIREEVKAEVQKWFDDWQFSHQAGSIVDYQTMMNCVPELCMNGDYLTASVTLEILAELTGQIKSNEKQEPNNNPDLRSGSLSSSHS